MHFVENMREAFAMQKASHNFSTKICRISEFDIANFNEMLTNDTVSFEQLGPDVCSKTFSPFPCERFFTRTE